ncbi:MAG: ATP-dependent sacrificial sulfur transferase LarE [Synergistaceae bacterium]|nr:ATP-dependent sacrificial sulfur transferase LarE [Synergistaceae bacterium]
MAEGSKLATLREYISSLGSAAVAFSGGVDSTFLLKVAHDVLGSDKVLAVTIDSTFVPARELDESKAFCESNNIPHTVIHVDELSIPGIKENPPNRCYLCKKALFTKILEVAHANNLAHVLEGSNLDDLGDYRPGLQAIDELGIKSPLRFAGLTKAEIRKFSWELGLKTWDKPSFACLASRFVYGEVLTEKKLRLVERSEQVLLDLGFRQFRVRIHGSDLARIELLPEDFAKILEVKTRTKIYDALKSLGFVYIALDLKGYRTGSMNETI